jgi:hypothetical protein
MPAQIARPTVFRPQTRATNIQIQPRLLAVIAFARVVLTLATTFVLASCADKRPPAATTVTVTGSASADRGGFTLISGTAYSSTGVIPSVQDSCTVKLPAPEVPYDARGHVMLFTEKPAVQGGSETLLQDSVLGIGWEQSDGSCEFFLSLGFPTPSPTPAAYILSITPDKDPRGSTTTWRIPTSEVSGGGRFRVNLTG